MPHVEGPPRTPASGREEKAASAEASIALLRVVVVAFGIAVYYLYFPGLEHPALAAAVAVVAQSYSLYLLLARPYLRFPALATSAWTAVTEGLLITLWLHATGGAASPFFLLWFVSLVGVSFRFDWRNTLLATGLYLSASVALVLLGPGPSGFHGLVVARLGYLLLAGIAAALLARESSRVFSERFLLGQQVEEAERHRALAEAHSQAQEALRESEERFRLLAEGSPLGIFHTDPDGRVDYASAKCREISGADWHDPEALRAAIHPDDAKRVARAWDASVRNGVELTAEFRFVHPGGRVVECWTRATPVYGAGGQLTGFVGSVEDTTLRRAAEARAREVQRLTEQARFKTAFINTAAHELGTPLTPILLQVHLLKKEVGGKDPTLARRVHILERNLERLRDLVRDILDGARMQASRLALHAAPTSLASLLDPCLQEIVDVASARGIAVEGGPWPQVQVHADADRVHQVVMNLLWNAVKFTPAGGHVALEARVADGHAEVRVHDTGIGIRGEDLPRLFQPFVQVHAPGQSPEAGTGLGLYICHGIVEQHGGRLWAKSAGPGKGSTFAFTLPLAQAA
ncbi:MAG TPA: ATP-binding protein [Candidatus Thermoplasmatota archaeon]|nr:ATP-binding protein [Candidatus Thermoplasmatota archaeon]